MPNIDGNCVHTRNWQTVGTPFMKLRLQAKLTVARPVGLYTFRETENGRPSENQFDRPNETQILNVISKNEECEDGWR